MDLHQRVQLRAEELPSKVWNCEGCGNHGSMEIRRSSLNKQFYADDITLKCMSCWMIRTHGVPLTNAESFEQELEAREGRILDFAQDGPADTVKENLTSLGYLGKAETR